MGENLEQGKPRGSFWRSLREFIFLFAIAVVLALAIQRFIVKPFYIPSGSMEETLLPGDRVLVNRFIYFFQSPHKGDIIVFQFPFDLSKDFIKRIVALPGDRIEINQGTVILNRKPQKEKYIIPDDSNMSLKKVEPDSFFVMGDNRPNSSDSRVWGALPRKDIIGKAFIIYWPLNRLRWF